MPRITFVLLCLAVAACAAPQCAGIAGSGDLWSRPSLGFVIVGEIHGTAETPAIFADLVCAARETKRPLIVGVELRNQKAVERFLGSAHEKTAIHDLLLEDEWRESDGRRSQAMLLFLQRLRTLKRERAISGVIAFSRNESAATDEEKMAATLQATATRIPGALVLVLVGNIHASKGPLPGIAYRLMASYLPAAETVSLLAMHRGGEAWNCQEGSCGPHKFSSPGGAARGIMLSEAAAPLPGFDGVLSTGQAATASPPAAPR